MALERFTRRMVALSHDPTVSILKNGIISLNKPAWVELAEPGHVELFYDGTRQIVGVKANDGSSPDAYPVRSQRGDAGPYLIAGTAFTRYYKIDLSISRRWIANRVDDMLCIDLTAESTAVTSNRDGRGRPGGPAAAAG